MPSTSAARLRLPGLQRSLLEAIAGIEGQREGQR
jgi:hypothetical protein